MAANKYLLVGPDPQMGLWLVDTAAELPSPAGELEGTLAYALDTGLLYARQTVGAAPPGWISKGGGLGGTPVASILEGNVGDGVNKVLQVTHGLASIPVVSVYDNDDGALVEPEIVYINNNVVQLSFNTAPRLGQYHVSVVG